MLKLKLAAQINVFKVSWKCWFTLLNKVCDAIWPDEKRKNLQVVLLMKQLLACWSNFVFADTSHKQLCSGCTDTKIYFKGACVHNGSIYICIHVEKALSKSGRGCLHVFVFAGSRTRLLWFCCVGVWVLCIWKSSALFLCCSLLSWNESIVTQSRIQMYLNFQAVTQIFSPSSTAPGLCTENMLFLQALAGTCCSFYEKWWCPLH